VFVRPTNNSYQNGAPLDAFAPRFGFAWHPGGAQGPISLRGGYGWFYQTFPPEGNTSNTPLISSPPFAQLFGNTGASNNLSTLQKPFPTTTLGFVLRTPVSQLTDRPVGPVFKIPRLQQWNLNAQVGFSSSFTLDVGYAGSHGNHLLLAHGFNQPLLAAPGNPVNCGLPNRASALGVSEASFANLGIDAAGCVTSNTSANASFRVPFVGETPTALLGQEYAGASWYSGLQVTLKNRLSHGLSFQVAYTFSKAETNTDVYNDQSNLHLDWVVQLSIVRTASSQTIATSCPISV
jgi:hypothetical protein